MGPQEPWYEPQIWADGYEMDHQILKEALQNLKKVNWGQIEWEAWGTDETEFEG